MKKKRRIPLTELELGSAQLDIDHNIQKQRLSADGEPLSEASIASLGSQPKQLVDVPESRPGCPSCYGAGYLRYS